jgi:dCTP deaminase
MSTLSGKGIAKLVVEERSLIIDPFDTNLIQPASYDLRLGPKILASPLSSEIRGMVIELTEKEPSYKIHSGQMVAVLSLERIELPLYICGRFGIRSAIARRGINAFGGLQLDPGWRGRLNLNLLNVGPEPVTITLYEPLFSIEFQRLEEPAETGYSGSFQNQDDFPADQYNYILSARTTSLAEIPLLRKEMIRVSALIEELIEEYFPDPDEGLELRPEIKEKLLKSSKLPRNYLIPSAEINKKLS